MGLHLYGYEKVYVLKVVNGSHDFFKNCVHYLNCV